LRDQEDNEYQHKGVCVMIINYQGIDQRAGTVQCFCFAPYYFHYVTALACDDDADDRLFLFSAFCSLEDPHEEMFARDQVGVFIFIFFAFFTGEFSITLSPSCTLRPALLRFLSSHSPDYCGSN
jgi:hypothetical protein